MSLCKPDSDLIAGLNSGYIGRFAPSPSGPLHFGSLVAAVASYLDAKSHQGKWLVRIEDLDPPREPAGTADLILNQLQAFGLQWDDDILFQSQRLSAYSDALEKLERLNLCFACNCTRARMQSLGSVYDGHCRPNLVALAATAEVKKRYAIRVKITDTNIQFEDLIQGIYHQNLRRDCGDFVVRRKDNFFAYQLAVVVDDAYQNISHIVRGFDLLESTPRQIYLQQKLGLAQPVYAHFPLAANNNGDKLSKQHYAQSIDPSSATDTLLRAMEFLGINTRLAKPSATPAQTLQWGVEHWHIQNVPKLATINGSWSA